MSKNEGTTDDQIGSAPTVDPDNAGRGGHTLEGMPGIHVVNSIGENDWDTYSNNSSKPESGG